MQKIQNHYDGGMGEDSESREGGSTVDKNKGKVVVRGHYTSSESSGADGLPRGKFMYSSVY